MSQAIRGRAANLPGEAVDILGGDGVALEWHGAGTDLPGAKRLAPFAKRGRLEDAKVEGKLVQAGAQPCQRVDDQPVLFAGIGLRGRLVCRQVQLEHDALFKLPRAVVAVGQQLAVAGGRADRALDPFAANVLVYALQFDEVFEQILAILGQAVTDSGRFGGLNVGEGDGGRVGFGLNAGRQC